MSAANVYRHPDGPKLDYNDFALTATGEDGETIVLPIGADGLLELAAQLAAIGKDAKNGIKNKRLSAIVHAFEFHTEGWWGEEWGHDEAFFIDFLCADASVMPNAPLVVYLRPECNPKEAAVLLRDLADYLDSDHLKLRPLVLPNGDGFDGFNFSGESEEVQEAYRQIEALEKQLRAIRQALPETDLPF